MIGIKLLKEKALKYAKVFFRIATGIFVGSVVSIIGQELIGYGTFMFCFLLSFFVLSFMRLSRKWGFIFLSCFNIALILIGFLIRLYIKIAPGG